MNPRPLSSRELYILKAGAYRSDHHLAGSATKSAVRTLLGRGLVADCVCEYGSYALTEDGLALAAAHGMKQRPKMSAKKLAERAAQGDLNPVSTLTSKAPKMATGAPVKGAAKRPTSTDPDSATVVLVLERDGYACGRCGDGIGDIRGIDWSVQHRVARGAGGTSLPERNMTGNLMILCGSATNDGCHAEVEGRGRADRDNGYWMERDSDGKPTDATTVPVKHALHGWVLLDNQGGYRKALIRVAA